MSKIFISHSSIDKELVDIFVNTLLICGIGFASNDIFCTSVEGLGIKTGEEWRNAIKEKIINSKVIILFITPHYKESEICLNEIGAAWTTDAMIIPVIVPPISFKTIGVLFDVKQAVQLTEGVDLDELRDSLQEFVSIENRPKTARWTIQKEKAVLSFEKILKDLPFLTPLSRSELSKLEEKLSETKQAFDELAAENQQLSELCKKLEEAKDKQDVIDIKHDIGLLEDYDDFLSKAEEIGKKINEFNPIVKTIIFNKFSKKDLTLSSDDRRSYEDSLKQAHADNIIDEEENLNHQHPRIAKVLKLLNDFEFFFPEKISEETYKKLEVDYPDILLETNSLGFWKEVFGVERLLFST